MGIKDVSRSVHVTRWHSIGVHRNQSVAEHSALSAFYSEFLLLAINPEKTTEEHLTVLRHGLWHDQPEVVTGDLCTPLKRLLESYFKNEESPLDLVEKAICKEYKELSEAVSDTYLQNILKLADYLDAIVFLEDEGKEKQAKKIQENIKNSYLGLILKSKEQYPQYKWSEANNILNDVLYGDPVQIDDLSFDDIINN
jgi:5'-deoxynucleotidase YfbR-like HD superfamily hydrolase